MTRIRFSAPSFGMVALVGLTLSAGAQDWQQVTQVDVAVPLVRSITDFDIYTGRVIAVQDVEIRAQVSGVLRDILFTEGDLVEAGDVLFVLDDRRARADLVQLGAQVAQAASTRDLAEVEFARASDLAQRQAGSQAEVDRTGAELAIAEAVLDAAEAAVERARIEVADTVIRAPFSGRIGAAGADIGALIDGGSTQGTLLSNLVSVDPVEIVFDASESDYLAYVRLDLAGQAQASRSNAATVDVRLPDETDWDRQGNISFVDNRLDASSGTIRIRARLANEGGLLTPGLFADVRVPRFGPYDALLVPDAAVLSDQAGRIVYVVGPGGTAEARQVEVGQIVDGNRVIRAGLSRDDRVVVSGLMMVQPGATVEATEIMLALTGEAAR